MPESSRGLPGKRIVVTRAAAQADELDDLLQARGATPLAYPCIAIAPPEDTTLLDTAILELAAGAFAWLVLTSRNTVTVLAERLRHLRLSPQALRPRAVAAVGSATAAAAVLELGLAVDLTPSEFVAEALAAALLARMDPGDRVLLCQADIARPDLAQTLKAAGTAVTSVVAYRTVPGTGGIDLPAHLAARRIDAITFTSSSTVRNLLARLEAEGGDRAALQDICLACLGPVTAATARQLGLTVDVMPATHTIPALVDALDAYFAP